MIRIGTIGTGDITTVFARTVRDVRGAEVAAVHSRDAGRAAALADDLGAPHAFSDLDEMLHSGAIDAVYVASPNSVHDGQARAALAAGLHVLVEKPAVLGVAAWDDLVGEADAAGRVLLEAMRTEYDSGLDTVRRLLPELGTLRRASLRYESRSARYARVLEGERPNIFDPRMGAGALMDLGVYPVHAMVSLFGAPETVQGAAATIATGTEGAGVIIATYPGLVVDVSYSKITRASSTSEIQGETATLAIDHIASPRRLRITSKDGERDIVIGEPQHALRGEVERFVELVEGGAPADVDHARTRETLRILEALRIVPGDG